jgi:hypothetical protein
MAFSVQNPKTGQVYDMEDEKEAQGAVSKGYVPLSVKNPKTGEIFNMSSGDEVSAALKKGYSLGINPPKPPAQKKQTTTWEDMNTTFDPALGFKDEVWGAVGALFDPSGVGGGFSERYEKYRDAQRGAVAEAKASSPIASTVSEFAGGIPAMAIPGAAGAKAAKAGIEIFKPVAASSLLTGVTEASGRSEAKDAGGYAKDIGVGAATSLVLPGAVKGIQLTAKGGTAIASLAKSLPQVFTRSGVGKVDALKNATGDIFSSFANSAALRQAVGAGPKTTDNEIKAKIFQELSQEGASPFKKWLAGEIATRSGNTGTAPQIEELFSLGSKARTEARAFDKDAQFEAAQSLSEALNSMQTNVKATRGKAFQEGMTTAAGEFEGAISPKKIRESLTNLQTEADDFIPKEGEQSILGDADQKKIKDAMRIIYQGDIKGISKIFPNVKAGDNPGSEQLFWRLQAARQMIDKWGKKLNRDGFNEQAVAMDGFRAKIDDVLKLSEAKAKTDVQYSEGSKAITPVFKAISAKDEGGKRFIEPTKVRSMFGESDRALGFESRMDNMQKYLKESGLPFDETIAADAFKQFKDVKTTAANRRLIEGLKGQGSSQSVQALAGRNAKNIVQEIIIRPSAIVQTIDEEIARRGGSFSEKELRDLAKWRSAFDQLAKDTAKGILPNNAWGLGLSFAASKLGTEYIKTNLQGTGE